MCLCLQAKCMGSFPKLKSRDCENSLENVHVYPFQAMSGHWKVLSKYMGKHIKEMSMNKKFMELK